LDTIFRVENAKNLPRAIGFRADSKGFHWAVAEGTKSQPILIAHDDAAAPKGYGEPKALTWYAGRVRHLLGEYQPSAGMVRSAEAIARGANKEGAKVRLRLEGVILQTLDAEGKEAILGALSTIGKMLQSKKPKAYLEANNLRGLDLTTVPETVKEAILAAVSALPK
jgi:hypothetical protein